MGWGGMKGGIKVSSSQPQRTLPPSSLLLGQCAFFSWFCALFIVSSLAYVFSVCVHKSNKHCWKNKEFRLVSF